MAYRVLDRGKWNEACDFAVSHVLRNAGIDPLAPVRPEFDGLSAADIYARLMQPETTLLNLIEANMQGDT